ncbi:MAG: TOMM precursor leader peptide-binding protein [Propionibacteriales bacterium]|nr:TOMM precursor leader peptide-binding protein [Propionibacteriales bacterium]
MDNEVRAPTVRLIGAGTVAQRLADLLVTDPQLERLWLADASGLDTTLYPPMGTGASNAEGLRHQLAGSPVDVRVLSHWSKPDGHAPGLTVVATRTAEPDRWIPQYLWELGDPYLVVRADHDRASVGPLVMPQSTPCLNCADMILARTEPRWWHYVVSASRRIAEPDALMTNVAAGLAAIQVRAFLRGQPTNALGNILELSSDDWTLRVRRLRAHPLCPWCGIPDVSAA